VDSAIYELPDKTNIEVQKEMYTIPESMFEKFVKYFYVWCLLF